MINILKNLKFQIQKKLRSNIDYHSDDKFLFVKNLRDKGFHYEKKFSNNNSIAKKILDSFKSIPHKTLDEIIQDFKNQPGRYNYRKYLTHFFDPKILEEYANQDIFIYNFKQYFGLEPKIRFISIWIDYPTNDCFEKNSQIFHRDSDDIFLVKTFLCLTKIKEDNGPFEFIETSHKRPWDLNLKNYINKESDLVRTFQADEGDMYIADTNGFHRGRLLSKGCRVLLTVHYVSSKPKVGFLNQVIN
jgi:hypothetical protein